MAQTTAASLTLASADASGGFVRSGLAVVYRLAGARPALPIARLPLASGLEANKALALELTALPFERLAALAELAPTATVLVAYSRARERLLACI